MLIAGIILILIVILAAVVLGKAILLKPTAAIHTKVELDTSDRAEKYGKQLSKLVQVETISSRYDEDRSKFLEFHKELETMFPNIHAT